MSRTGYWTGEEGETVAEDWSHAHVDYHSELLSACRSPRLRDLAASLRETAELHLRWSASFSTDRPPRDVLAEHRELMEAALDHDAERAFTLLTSHINMTASLLEFYVEHHLLQPGGGDLGADAAG